MKDKNLVPKNNNSTQETIHPTNHKKLSEALRNDMRRASEEILSLRRQMVAIDSPIAKNALFEIDRALAALDCSDHIPVMSDIQHTGIITAFRKITTRKGQQMAIMTLDTGVDIVVFPRTLQKLRKKLENLAWKKEVATFDCQDSDDDRDEYFLNSIVGFERIENTTEALEAEQKRVFGSDDTYPVCDDCGRKNCICDGGWSTWSGE